MSLTTRQPDLLGAPQPDLFAQQAPPAAPSPERMATLVRPRLAALLTEARAAVSLPWDAQKTSVNALLFHNMANWLPEAEREAQRAAFRAELSRLGYTP
jgi:hypothetical protein